MESYRYIQELIINDEHGFEKKSLRSMISLDTTNIKRAVVYNMIENYAKSFIGIVKNDDNSIKAENDFEKLNEMFIHDKSDGGAI